MPNYDYKCFKCGLVSEEYHKMLERPQIKCECGEIKVKTISAGINAIFKGSGFYSTQDRL